MSVACLPGPRLSSARWMYGSGRETVTNVMGISRSGSFMGAPGLGVVFGRKGGVLQSTDATRARTSPAAIRSQVSARKPRVDVEAWFPARWLPPGMRPGGKKPLDGERRQLGRNRQAARLRQAMHDQLVGRRG